MKAGQIEKFKSRWCANGMWMQCDQEETWAPTARMTSVRTMYALAATLGQTVYSGDIPGAYLKAPIDDGTVVSSVNPKVL